jgi:hypothetical protein
MRVWWWGQRGRKTNESMRKLKIKPSSTTLLKNLKATNLKTLVVMIWWFQVHTSQGNNASESIESHRGGKNKIYE